MQIPNIRDYAGKRIHLIGIGGSSMSGLAEMLLDQGYAVTGSDRSDGYLLDGLREKGIRVYVGHAAENVHGADLVVYSGAISAENPERAECARLGIPTMERSVLLGQLMDGHQWSVGVCGAHGKTTTTAMLSQMLLELDMDPSIHIGGRLDAIGGSTRVGHSEIFVSEACEFRRSFLEMRPTMAVVLNIDADHLDCYRDIDEIEETFGKYMDSVPAGGVVVGNGDDPRIVRQMQHVRGKKVTFGFGDACTYHLSGYQEDEKGCPGFVFMREDRELSRVQLQVAGRFNALNAMAALSAVCELGADMEKAGKILSDFRGVHRRFEKTDEIDGVEIFHDYGHNPAEMRNALSVGRKRCRGRLIAVMQPHTFSRVRALFEDYLTCCEAADLVLVTDICAAREADPGDLNSGMLVEGMKKHGLNAVWTPSFDDTEAYLRAHWQSGDLVLTMGCGDINMLNSQIHRHEMESGRKQEAKS